MKKQHKYFRNLRYKEKLESKVHAHRTYWSHVMFYTEEPDPRDLREHSNSIYGMARYRKYNGSLEAAVEDYVEYDRKIGNGRFIYFERPEVPYTIHKVYTKHKYSKERKRLCKYANRLVRTRWKQYGEVYQHMQYKKVFDVAWELD